MKVRLLTLCLMGLLAVQATPSRAEMSGVVRPVDGDTFDLDAWRVRLYGIDAPETRQTCERDGETWKCGLEAAWALARKTEGQTVRCEEKGRDHMGIVIAVCHVGGLDLGAWMVERGWAVALRDPPNVYGEQEQRALADGLGIWAGRFVVPADWRQGRRLED